MFFRIGIFVLLAVTTFLIVPSFDVTFEASKPLFFRIMLSGLLFVWLLKTIVKEKVKFPALPRSVLFGLIFIIAANLISFGHSIDISQSFFGSSFRQQGLYTCIHYGLLFVFVLSMFRRHDWKYVTSVIGAIMTVEFSVSAWQFFIVKDAAFFGRATGTLGNPVYLGQLAALLSPILFSAVLTNKRKILWAIPFLASLGAIILGGSRGAALGLIVGLMIYALYCAKRFQKLWIAWTIGGVLASLFIIFVFINMFASQPWIQHSTLLKRATFTNTESTQPIQTRFEIWKGTLQLIGDYPLFGVGQDVFDIAFEPYAPPALTEHPEQYADRAHNLSLDLLASYGVFGFLAYACFFFFLCRESLRAVKHEKKENALIILGMISGFISLIVATQFNFFVLVHHMYFWTLTAMLLVFISKKEKIFSWKLPPLIQYSLIAMLTVLVGLNILY